jgi:hypothetical protein
MGLNLIINSSILQNHFTKNNSIYMFLSHVNIDTNDLFHLRMYLKNKHLIFKRLNTKQLNKVVKICSLKNVVLKIKNKNYHLASFNLSIIFLNNFFIQVYILFYFFYKYFNKISILYFKINNIFLTFSFFNELFKNYFLNENYKTLTFFQYVSVINEKFFSLLFYLKNNFYKLFLFFKLLLYFRINFIFYKILIK